LLIEDAYLNTLQLGKELIDIEIYFCGNIWEKRDEFERNRTGDKGI
jgi:hypothetical protein